MTGELTRSITFCDLATNFLRQVLYNDAYHTILIVCSTRSSFLYQLYAEIRTQTDDPESHQLLEKSPISMISKSSRVTLALCPTLEHLRAYVSVLRVGNTVSPDGAWNGRPMLAILDLVALHIPALEFSAQGLSRTLAMVVEVAAREGMHLMLCECRDVLSLASHKRGEDLWYERVPVLSGSVQIGDGDDSWGGHAVYVRQIAERWFELGENNRDAMHDGHVDVDREQISTITEALPSIYKA